MPEINTQPAEISQESHDKRLLIHGGHHYVHFMELFRNWFDVQSYFEIGSRAGQSIAPVQCQTVSVDPQFLIQTNIIQNKPSLHLFQMTSDAFFAKHDPSALFGGPIDMAFLDGLHIFEYLLRDFLNTERHMKRNGVVFMHDCLPMIFGMTARNQKNHTGGLGWTGDVWKVVAILKKYRPELRVHALDCPPTGLVMITNLDNCSDILEKNYYDIVDEFSEAPTDNDKLIELYRDLHIVKTREIKSHSDIAKFCWL